MIARRVAALTLALAFAQRPLSDSPLPCDDVAAAEVAMGDMVMQGAAIEVGCMNCLPQSQHTPCDHSSSGQCATMASCTSATAELEARRHPERRATDRVASGIDEIPTSVTLQHDPPPPRA